MDLSMKKKNVKRHKKNICKKELYNGLYRIIFTIGFDNFIQQFFVFQ